MGKRLILPRVYCRIHHAEWLCHILTDWRKVKVLYFHLISLKLDLHHRMSLIFFKRMSQRKPFMISQAESTLRAMHVTATKPVRMLIFTPLFQTWSGVSFCLTVFTSVWGPASTLCSLWNIWHCVRKYSHSLSQKSQSFSEGLLRSFQPSRQKHTQSDLYVVCAVWEGFTCRLWHSYGNFLETMETWTLNMGKWGECDSCCSRK